MIITAHKKTKSGRRQEYPINNDNTIYHRKCSGSVLTNPVSLRNQKQFKMFDQNIGKHCSQSTCRQKDWLPVKCKYCAKVFCADHCSIESHRCPQYEKEYKKVYSCPLCNKTLALNPTLTVEENFSIHEALDCQRDFQANVPHLPTCTGLHCHAKLTTLNSYQCARCQHKVCLKHRMPEDHRCTVK